MKAPNALSIEKSPALSASAGWDPLPASTAEATAVPCSNSRRLSDIPILLE